MDFGIKTIKNRLIIKEIAQKEVTESGIIFPPDKENMKSGIVVACTDKCSVKVGDIVVFNHDVGAPIKHEGIDYLVMRDDNLMAFIPKEEKQNAVCSRVS